jgi:hypothetical protein
MGESAGGSGAANPIGTAVHEVYWSDALPWWILFRAAAWAFTPTVVLLATGGLLATWAGWSLADRLTLPGASGRSVASGHSVQIDPAALGDGLAMPLPTAPALPAPSAAAMPYARGMLGWVPAPLRQAMQLAATPFSPSASMSDAGGALARLGWFVVVWSIFATAITRHVALKLVGEESLGLFGSLGYGVKKWPAAFNAAIFVLLGIFTLSLPAALLGLAMRTEWGLTAVAVIWPLVLAGAIVLSILALGLAAGWPLMAANVGVERGDAFQAISTAFSYVFQRPLHYAFYLAVAGIVLVPSLFVAGLFADATATLAVWAASWGMGHARTAELLGGLENLAALPPADAAAANASWGLRGLDFWHRCLASLLGAFGWGYFWAVITATYLLLRRDVDGTEMDEVVLAELPGEDA